jgi:hypothetical protein
VIHLVLHRATLHTQEPQPWPQLTAFSWSKRRENRRTLNGKSHLEVMAWWWWVCGISIVDQEWLGCGCWGFGESVWNKKLHFLLSLKAAEFALSLSFMGWYPEVLTLKVSQRSRVVCWENVQLCVTLAERVSWPWNIPWAGRGICVVGSSFAKPWLGFLQG